MEDKSSNTQILDKIKAWVLENLVDELTDAALLVGSWAEGRAREKSDIDIILIKNNQPTLVKNIKKNVEGKNLDIWIHTHEYMMETLQKDVSSLSDIYQKSLFLSFFGNCIVWFEKDKFVQNNAQICKEWKWESEHRIYVKMLGKPPSAEWARKAYEENLQILGRFEHNFDNNLPISHRLKDYPELHKPVERTRVMDLYKIIIPIFEHLNIEREWTEILDSKKAILEEDWAVAFVSLKDVLYFLLRRYVSPPSMERRDPSFWRFLETKIVPQEYIKALEIAYLE
ncbi:MAG: hypothetical protein ACTSQF_01505 [Candidatus Heimdallarchaeaceae archaeon]